MFAQTFQSVELLSSSYNRIGSLDLSSAAVKPHFDFEPALRFASWRDGEQLSRESRDHHPLHLSNTGPRSSRGPASRLTTNRSELREIAHRERELVRFWRIRRALCIAVQLLR